jgi:hypothetical protein
LSITRCRISKDEVKRVINYGEVIEEKPNDSPFPSYLMLDFINRKPLHVVFSDDKATGTGYVVTAYIPNSNLWTDNFRKRR